MTDYDLHKLSPTEFEDLSRDLIQAEKGITFESFKPGKDLGIDGRFIIDNNYQIILQCKRYATLTSLLASLRKEVPKMEAQRGELIYLLATSLKLSPPDKTKIAKALSPLVELENQIYGREDLNNLIAQNIDIERRWVKLWLQNGDALNRIVNLDLVNRNRFFMRKAKHTVKTYARDYNYLNCLEALSKERGIIITGDPGVGKSAVAHILAVELTAYDFEVKVVGDDVNNALRQFLPEKKQVFIYDDFLGENIMDKRLRPGEQDDIISLLEMSRESRNTFVILISRNYLLNEARKEYERMNRYLRQRSTAIVEVNHHHHSDRADIIYQHLYAADIPAQKLHDFVVAEQYLPIVRHNNFNPRIVEAIFKSTAIERLTQKELKKKIEHFLDNPFSVWEYPFRNGINDLARDVLLVLLTFDGLVEYNVLFEAVESYREQQLFEPEFKANLAVLSNVFIDQHKVKKIKMIQFVNPSIRDFLVHYVEQHKHLLAGLIDKAIFHTQLTSIYVYSDHSKLPFGEDNRMVVIPSALKPAYEAKLIEQYGFPMAGQPGLFGARYLPDDEGLLMHSLSSMSHTITRVSSGTKELIRSELKAIIDRKLYENYDRDALSEFIKLLAYYDIGPDGKEDGSVVPIIPFIQLAEILLPAIKRYEHRDIIEELKAFYPVRYYDDLVKTDLVDRYAVRLSKILLEEAKRNPVDNLSFELRLVEGRLGIELDDIHEKIHEYSYKVAEEDGSFNAYDAIGMGHDDLYAHQEQQDLREQFSTLLS